MRKLQMTQFSSLSPRNSKVTGPMTKEGRFTWSISRIEKSTQFMWRLSNSHEFDRHEDLRSLLSRSEAWGIGYIIKHCRESEPTSSYMRYCVSNKLENVTEQKEISYSLPEE
ncbi:hypothetical protein Rs2_45047 [Raphanus sativus]|nr:hypothetical protein Rs2_45047 [Raphanus sativus]